MDPKLPEDLSALSRRGAIDEADRRRLQMALLASPSLQCAHRLGKDFDELETTRDSDARIIEQLVARAHRRYAGTNELRRRPLVWRILPWVGVATLLLVSAAAGATLWPYARQFILAPSESTTSTLPRLPVQRSPSESGVAVRKANEGSIDRAQSEAQAAEVATTSPRPAGSESSTSPSSRTVVPHDSTETSASTLFSQANAARRQGDVDRARALYHRLSTSFPTASEAALSYVLLARLELGRHAPAAALRGFDRYLALAPTGPLAAEALEGRASAYRMLGAPVEEARAWRELLSRHPNTIYAKTARERLLELP